MADETKQMLEARQYELKSLENFNTDNTFVQRLINDRMHVLKQDIRSYEEMIRSVE